MVEKRSIPRRKPSTAIRVSDDLSGEDLGNLANLTPEGLMLVSREPIALNSILQLRIQVPPAAKRAEKLCFGAESLWTSQAEDEGEYFWTGFSIIDISNDAADFIERWIEDWAADGQ
jgi:hypothetical protein